MKKLLIATLLFTGCFAVAQGPNLEKDYKAVEGKVIDWRRDIQQNPE
jgi:amidohydrolase